MKQTFRAYDKRTKTWLCHYKEIGGFALMGECVIFGEWAMQLPSIEFWNEVEIMQATGLYEGGIETGADIYIGDIMLAPSGNYFQVIWHESEMGIKLRDKDGFVFNFNVPLYKLAGNIFDTPDLLK